MSEEKATLCKNCRFYTKAKDKVGQGASGFCHLKPPIISVQMVATELGRAVPAYITAYPQVEESLDWCGEFRLVDANAIPRGESKIIG